MNRIRIVDHAAGFERLTTVSTGSKPLVNNFTAPFDENISKSKKATEKRRSEPMVK
jgi:hypothetical protein